MPNLRTATFVAIAALLHRQAFRAEPREAPPPVTTAANRRLLVEGDVAFARIKIAGQRPTSIEVRMRHYGVPGLSLAVIKDYQLDWAAAYGLADVATNRKTTTETLFEPGSISKSLNAYGVLRLVDEHRLELDQDINRYLTSWQFPYDDKSAGEKISVAMLLSHTAGLNVHGFLGYHRDDSLPTTAQILDGRPPANSQPVRSVFAPGQRFRYSGGGTMITQQIVEDVTRMRYDEYLQQRVFAPLTMTNSFFTQPPPPTAEARLATGYSSNGSPVLGGYPILREQAAGGLWTTPTDLAKFVIDLQLSLEGRSNKVLSTATARLMTTPVFSEAPGLGVVIEDIQGVKYFQHRAGNRGFSGVYFGSMRGGYGAVVFINSDGGTDLLDEILRTVALAYRWPGFPRDSTPTKTAIPPPVNADRLVGTYREQTAVATIEREGDSLWYRTGESHWPILFTSPTTFVNQESTAEKRLLLDSAGRVLGFSRVANGAVVGRATRVAPQAPTADEVARYLGEYHDVDGTTATVLSRDGKQWLLADELEREIHFLSPTEFYTFEDRSTLYRFTVVSSVVTSLTAEYPDRQVVLHRSGAAQ